MISFNANDTVRTENAAGHGLGGSLKAAIGIYNLDTPLVAGQIIPMVAVPSRARILDMHIASDVLDSGSGLTLNVGDTEKQDRFFAASDIGRQGGVKRLDSKKGIAHRYENSSTINLAIKTAPSSQAAQGAVNLTVFYVID